jgi:4-amino-4-deoxy-L-arabinose transferase-like glycosyltransferase
VTARRVGALLAALVCLAVLVDVERAPERPLVQQPFPDSAEYTDSARSLARDEGFYTFIYKGHIQPPRYPPGYPMALAPFAAVGSYPRDVQRGAKFWAMGYVLVAALAAWALGGPLAAAIAAILIGVSPFAKDSAGLVLSDAFIAMLTVLVVPLLRYQTKSGARLAGLASGLATIVRLTAGVNLIGLLVAMPRPRFKTALLWALPSLVGLGLLQWLMFGSPLKTGYSYWGVAGHFFSLSYATGGSVIREGPFIFPDRLNGSLLNFVCPCQTGGPQNSMSNLAFYPALLAGLFWVYSPPFIPLIGLAYAWRKRREAIGRYTLTVTAISLIVLIFYQFQGTRFLAGPATLLVVLASACLAEILRWLSRLLRRSLGHGGAGASAA